MYSKGHTGLSLLISSLFMFPFGYSEYALFVIFISAALSALPDYDMKWRQYGIKHRGKHTHSILFAFISGLILGVIFFWAFNTLLWSLIGFSGAFIGVISHLLGDTLTYHAFKPLWPISDREIAYGFCTAKDPKVNELLLIAGVVVFVLYFLITSNSF